MISVLDDLHREIRKESKNKYNYAEWERKREQVKQRLEKLPEYIEKAASMIKTQKKPGPDKILNLVQRTTLLLFARLMNKSNRDMEKILLIVQPLFRYLLAIRQLSGCIQTKRLNLLYTTYLSCSCRMKEHQEI